jgi:hypothetical protein
MRQGDTPWANPHVAPCGSGLELREIVRPEAAGVVALLRE